MLNYDLRPSAGYAIFLYPSQNLKQRAGPKTRSPVYERIHIPHPVGAGRGEDWRRREGIALYAHRTADV